VNRELEEFYRSTVLPTSDVRYPIN